MTEINLLEQSTLALEHWREKEREWGLNYWPKLKAVQSGILGKINPEQKPNERFYMSKWQVQEISGWKIDLCRIALRALGFSRLIDLSIQEDEKGEQAMFGQWDGRAFDPENTSTLEQVKGLLEHLDEHHFWSPDEIEDQ